MPKRKIRSHGQVPAGWTWRDGRPRWNAAPGLRKAGWKSGHDLKDGRGQWLERGASIDAAQAIAGAVAMWRAGEAIPAAYAALAPAGALLEGQTPPPAGALDPFSLGQLETEFLAHIEAERSAGTLRDYRGKMGRLLDAFGGYARLPDRDDKAGQAARAAKAAETRAMTIFALEPYEGRSGIVDPWTTAYRQLRKHAGENQAYGVMATAGAFLAWVHRYKTRRVLNWANTVERTTPEGRIVTLTWDEIAALVRAADALGLSSVGDAIVLAFDLGWSQVDILSLTWSQIRDGRVAGARAKTGRKGTTPMTYLGKGRLAALEARLDAADQQAGKVVALDPEARRAARHGPVIVCERTRRAWKPDHFRHVFGEEVRPLAAKTAPTVASKTFADLRDTAFTWGTDAGLSKEGKASRTRQSLKNLDQLGDRHYGEISRDVADQAALQMEALFKARGVIL
ncbi:MAG TPA: hypothetical protein VEA44_16050 [Caulobacter sp.]|nr:hypothetical protein [Caulobacter sp.]